MHNNHGKRTRGKRGGFAARNAELRDIHAKVRNAASHNLHGTSATAIFADRAKYFDCALIEETRETHIIPRESITVAQRLEAFPQRIETEEMPAKQLDKANEVLQAAIAYYKSFPSVERAKTYNAILELMADLHVGMIGTTDNRQTWKSDKSLLRKGNPFAALPTVKREGSVSVGLNKRRNYTLEVEQPLQAHEDRVSIDEEE